VWLIKAKANSVCYGGKNGALFYQCIDCHEDVPFVYTEKKLSTQDVVINIVNNLADLNKQLEAEAGKVCSKCKSGTVRPVDVIKCRRMALNIVECNGCHFSVPVISLVGNTLFAYSHDIQLAKKAAKEFPEIALVFCVSALETYFRQLFQYHSELNEYLIDKRRVNFQALDETRKILKKEFGFDIQSLIKVDWQFLCDKFRLRHRIIHCASFEKNGTKIKPTEAEIEKLFSVIENLVYNTEMELFKNNIVI
jgi:hypothetical protein